MVLQDFWNKPGNNRRFLQDCCDKLLQIANSALYSERFGLRQRSMLLSSPCGFRPGWVLRPLREPAPHDGSSRSMVHPDGCLAGEAGSEPFSLDQCMVGWEFVQGGGPELYRVVVKKPIVLSVFQRSFEPNRCVAWFAPGWRVVADAVPGFLGECLATNREIALAEPLLVLCGTQLVWLSEKYAGSRVNS
jgi:hypothetical protein